jgi:hypothetical protein
MHLAQRGATRANAARVVIKQASVSLALVKLDGERHGLPVQSLSNRPQPRDLGLRRGEG